MSTGHANGTRDMLKRMETMILMGMDLPVGAVRGQIAAGIDLIVHLGRMRDRSRKLLEISEIIGVQDGQIKVAELYRFEETGEGSNGKVAGKWVRKETLCHQGKLRAAGLAREE